LLDIRLTVTFQEKMESIAELMIGKIIANDPQIGIRALPDADTTSGASRSR